MMSVTVSPRAGVFFFFFSFANKNKRWYETTKGIVVVYEYDLVATTTAA